MRCPNCGAKVGKDRICENCKLKFVYEDNKQSIYIAIIIFAVFLAMLALIFNFIVSHETKKQKPSTTTTTRPTSDNIGYQHNFSNPAYVGETLIASYFDGDSYYDVDVKGIRFIDSYEASKYISPTKIGFAAFAFEYVVTFNELDGRENINPVLNATFALYNGFDFIKYNETKYKIGTKSIYDGGNIKNKESAKIIVAYELPEEYKDYSICLGYYTKKIACFTKKEV